MAREVTELQSDHYQKRGERCTYQNRSERSLQMAAEVVSAMMVLTQFRLCH